MYDFSSMLGFGVFTILIMLVLLVLFFFVTVAWNGFLYWIGMLFLKYNKSYSEIFRMFLKVVGITWGVSILGAILIGFFSLFPGGAIIVAFFNFLLGLLVMFLLYYLVYKYGISFLKLKDKESLYATLVFLVVKIIFFVITMILFYAIYALMLVSILGAMSGGMMGY